MVVGIVCINITLYKIFTSKCHFYNIVFPHYLKTVCIPSNDDEEERVNNEMNIAIN